MYDDYNNAYLVFRNEEDQITIPKSITENLHVMNNCKYNQEWSVLKRRDPARIPGHLRGHITIVNYNTIITNITNINLNSPTPEIVSKSVERGSLKLPKGGLADPANPL
ncbi:hypothetical protein BZG36_05694 [Bifiguratus adelaidae]|uniref:Uncharacterized protein n=1 Tax=Bifiguratus adelaidae TaxID=1938954 RepID=A0A261XTW7_9FUNG|nr:hypothetical protein BZG36_05694 [Bifiguratus adelaidae]